MRPESPLDPNHPRCRYPDFGQRFDTVLKESGLGVIEVARRASISPEIVRGYRRGFNRPSPTTQARLEAVFGMTLDVADNKPAPGTLTLPADVVMSRDESGDLTFSIRVPAGQIADFLKLLDHG